MKIEQDLTIVLTWDEEDQAYNVEVKELAGCYTWGRELKTALFNAREAIAAYLGGEE